ncbi:MAG TPA: hypothetical protein VKR56_04745 [Candidatus Cybelea sp.]|nr:hypothetical protein [Candidatus Cybelea sp.]
MFRLIHALRYAACLGVLTAALTNCAGLPPGTSPVAPLDKALLAHSAGSQTDLLYAGAEQRILVFTYPGGTFVDTFKTPFLIQAMCSDAKGDVFIPAEVKSKSGADTGYVYEYAHGGKSPVTTLDVPSHQIPVNCSSDPTTGNLAVTSYDVRDYAPLVEIYSGGSGNPTLFHSKVLGANPQPAYDAGGNLLAISGGNVAALLPTGAQNFKKITLSKTIGNVAHAQWDGKYFALQSYAPTKYGGEDVRVNYFRVRISGAAGTIVGISRFVGWLQKTAGQSWIQSDTLVATPETTIKFWNYPAGLKAFKVLHPTDSTQAVTVSIAR